MSEGPAVGDKRLGVCFYDMLRWILAGPGSLGR